MGVESIAADLARCLSDWVGTDRPSRAEALEAYAAVRPLSADELCLIDAFERTGALLGPGIWVRWHFREGRRFDDPSAVVQGIERGLKRLNQMALGPFAR